MISQESVKRLGLGAVGMDLLYELCYYRNARPNALSLPAAYVFAYKTLSAPFAATMLPCSCISPGASL